PELYTASRRRLAGRALGARRSIGRSGRTCGRHHRLRGIMRAGAARAHPPSPRLRKEVMKNECVLVTGATKGIGWAISRRLADLGCHVVGLARHTQDIDFPGYLYSCDLSNAGETEDILRVIREKYPVDAIVNNVGIVKPEALGEIDLSSLYQVYDLNLRVAV